jgi:ribose 5-phosphate isomerase A
MMFFMDLTNCKKLAGEKAASLIKPNTIVGLGTGSTATFFIQKLVELCQNGLKIQAVPTSENSFRLAAAGNIPLIEINTITAIDTYVDGADEIDPHKQIIKGGGGALLREKIVATMSKETIIIVDESKQVKRLGNRPLPVEILPFGHTAILQQLQLLGYTGVLRHTPNKELFVTENNNLIYDVHLTTTQNNPLFHHQQITSIPGVVDTGFFLGLADRVITAFLDGQVIIN